MTLDKFLLLLAEKAGLTAADPKLAGLLAHTELSRINVEGEVETALNQNLLSLTDAKNNHPAIKGHYFAEIMANVDRSLNDVYTQVGFSAEEIAEFNKERSSTKRIPLVTAKLKEKLAATPGDKTDKDATALRTQIDSLNAELASAKTALTTKESEFNGKLKAIQTGSKLEGKLGAVKTIYDTLDSSVRNLSLTTLLNNELQNNAAEIQLDESGNLKLAKKDGSNYYDENNRPVTIDDFINKTLTKNKLLPQNPGEQQQQQQQQSQQQNPGGSGSGDSTKKANVGNVYKNALASLQTNPTTVI